MRLKSLELVGFKSFFDPTTILFSPGITAVVGPNGCGKSNVIDAIRWVLGEQAPTRLRGKTTEDLIYAGNDSNPAAGMAEVALTLEADDNSRLPEPFTALSEICVTRRVYRSGDSEYLINRLPCRLKDITEFFMAAQIHSRGYALIEQGRIEEIIQAKPAEVRGFVEEAAGLSLFKGRREMSERKLERVRENLARVDDVIAEIDRQLNYARRQAKKAEAFRAIKVELSELERLSAARRLMDQLAQFREHSARALELEDRLTGARADAASAESDSAAAITALAARRDRLATLKHELESLEAAAAQRVRSREFLERRRAAADQSAPQLARRIGELEAKASAARAARAAAGARMARELNAEDDSEAALAALKRDRDAAQTALTAADRAVEAARDDLAEALREAAVVRGRLGALSGERAELEDRLGAPRAESLDLALASARAAAEESTEAAAGHRAEADRLEQSLADAAALESSARAAAEAAAARLGAFGEALSTAEAHAERLAQSGAARRLRTVLDSLNGDGPAIAPAMLAQVMRAPAALAPALAAVLGGDAEAVIVESPGLAMRAIEILKEKNSGRLSFVPDPGHIEPHATIDAPGIAGRLLDMIEVDATARAAAEAILGHVVLADDLGAAMAASNLNGHGTLFVTRDGDLVSPGRLITGGSAPSAADSASISSAGLPLEEARARAATAREELAAQRANHDSARSAMNQIRNALSEARRAIAAADRVAVERRTAVAKAEADLRLSESRAADARRRLDDIVRMAADSNSRLEELALAEQAMREQLGAARATAADCKATVERAAAAMREAASRVEARRAKLTALEQELGHLRRLADEIESQLDQDIAALARIGAERADLERELEALDLEHREAAERASTVGAEAEFARAETEAAEAAAQHSHAALTAARAELEAADRETMECALRCERTRTLSEELARGFAEKFETEFAAVADEMAAALAGRDAAADDVRLEELRARAARLGEVNLAAESEVRELEERAGALNAERADLDAAVKDLAQTVNKLNREARRIFNETFEAAARNFAELFPKLMRGGKGRLELLAADDVLDAGVEILVQPPGKKVKEIGLLSGGEKALSAMALIFSLFLLNPSPFCVMDEVDAPLDEFSLAAFVSLVEELKGHSQFIVITHNQRTMQRADNIHGVTMERPGISRLISLKIPRAA